MWQSLYYQNEIFKPISNYTYGLCNIYFFPNIKVGLWLDAIKEQPGPVNFMEHLTNVRFLIPGRRFVIH